MTWRMPVLFVVICAVAVGGLIVVAGGWSTEKDERAPVKRATPADNEVETEVSNTGPAVQVPFAPISPSMGKNVFVEAPPENLRWEDPDNPGFAVEIPYFIPWKLTASSVLPLATGQDGPVGARCEDVVFRTYRAPENHVEAMALRRGDQDLVLHREFHADEARIFGRLAAKLRSRKEKEQVELGRDTVLELTKNLHITDHSENVEIIGDQIRIHPKLGTATGTGEFRVRHVAFTVTGDGIDLHRLDADRTRIEIHRRALLEMADEPESEDVASVVDFGGGDFRRASARSEGRAIVRHEIQNGENRLQIEMVDHVHVTHEGGRSLDARRLVVVAVNKQDPEAPTDTQAGGWRLQQMIADGGVELRHTEETRPGQVDVVKITTDLLTHDVPDRGVPSTLLEGRTTLTFEGSAPLGGVARSGGVIHASCQKRAWIGPIRGSAGPQGVPATDLRRVLLAGNARVEHSGSTADPVRDVLEGDEIELLFQVASATDDAAALAPAREQVTALEFTARGNVRISGSRLRGSTDLLVARDVQGLRPHIALVGSGTRVSFPDIGRGQRLLGPDEKDPQASRGGPASGDPTTAGEGEDQWVLRRLDAEGDVDVVTSLGGPSVGMPTHLAGTSLSYDELASIAELRGTPARLEAEAVNGETQRFTARSLSLERALGRVRATGGVRGELWTVLNDLSPETVLDAFRSETPDRVAVLEIETEDRIDIDIVRVQDSGQLARDTEQWIRISGPLTAELRSDSLTIDRLRARSLAVALALGKPKEEPAVGAPVVARAAPNRRESSGAPTTRAAERALLSKVTLEAGELTADILEGHARSVEAFGGVTLESEMGRVSGDRLVLRGDQQSADVIGSATRKAEAWFYEDGGLRNQVQSSRFTVTWTERGAESLRAAGTPDDRVVAMIYHKGEPDSRGVSLLERFEIASGGPITIQGDRVDATDVWVSRSTRKTSSAAWSDTAVLYAPQIEVTGQNLLSAPKGSTVNEARRRLAKIIARGPETYFRYRADGEPIQIWGTEFLLDVQRNEAQLTGTPVKYQEGDRAHSEWKRATIDLDTGLPRLEGPHVTLRAGDNGKRGADERRNASPDDK